MGKYFNLILSFWTLFGQKEFSRYTVPFAKKLYFTALILPHAKRLSNWKNSQQILKLFEESNRSSQIFASVLSPYLHQNWTLIDRINAVEQHYKAVDSYALLIDLTSDKYFNLIPFKNEYSDVRIVVDRPVWTRNEGEVAISFFYQKHRLHQFIFTIIQHENAHVIVVGGVQSRGGSALLSVEEIKKLNIQMTKVIHGLHPKIFLLYMLKMLAAEWGLKQIWDISDVNHRSNHHLVKSKKYSSYDRFWTEHSGVLNRQGFYAISTEIRIKPKIEIPQNKRALFRRRYEMLEQLQTQFEQIVKTNGRNIIIHNS